ncbi:MAG: glycosyl hydrolase family 57 [Verrucomicrobiota bacterium]
MKTATIFDSIVSTDCPDSLEVNPESRRADAFKLGFTANGEVPFPQVIVRGPSGETVYSGKDVKKGRKKGTYAVTIPEGKLGVGRYDVQFEGCRQEDWQSAGGEDWVKAFASLEVKAPPRPKISVGDASAVKIFFGIHKHMHQPYYDAANPDYWDGEKGEIFGSRRGAYSHFVPTAIRHYGNGDLPHGGLSTSWSGSLIEQLNGKGGFPGWADQLRWAAQQKTSLGNPRCDFTAFGFFHPLMALTPSRNIVKQIEWHRGIIQSQFGVPASDVLFPPETAFHVRMIPALNEAGIRAVIYDSIHRFRACQEYPYAGVEEGMLPPNESEQVNPPVDDWQQLHNIWAGSKISPSLLRPEWIVYTDPDGVEHKIIGVPAERYIGNEDARGGFGALQYPAIFGQLHDQICEFGTYDPKHPPFFLLHSDGDNYGGGTDSYYDHNTMRMVEWLKSDPRFELCGVKDYLDQFPPDPKNAVHVEPGSWSGADNGDPQFMKWFSRYDQSYSPDLNSWAVLTALQNCVHALEDAQPDHTQLGEVQRLMLTAETSCYWYWTGQQNWDQQVTNAANKAWHIMGDLNSAVQSDTTGPTIFAPWVMPENPGGKAWGNNCLKEAPREAQVHTFIYDLSGLNEVTLTLRAGKKETVIKPSLQAPYPSETGPGRTADHVVFDLPVGAGDCRYFITAIDQKGNVSKSALERVFLA